jgi:hypothetical protein
MVLRAHPHAESLGGVRHGVVRAENPVRAGQAGVRYSWITPPRLSVSVQGEGVDLIGFEGVGELLEGCGRGEGAVGAVAVVVPLVLVKCVSEVGLVSDQGAVQ